MTGPQRTMASIWLTLIVTLVAPLAADDIANVEVTETPETIDEHVGERLLMSYHIATSQPPEGIDPIFARSGHIHPITTPHGHVVTAEFPEDHAHQHGLFAAWVNTLHAGRKIDFWNQAGGTGDVRHVEVLTIQSGNDIAEFEVRLEHVAKNEDGTTTPVLSEVWTLRTYNRGDVYMFDITSTQRCIHAEPLHVLEYHYGGMAMRGPTEWLGTDPDVLVTSEGLSREPGNHSRPNWVVMSGELDGEACGIAVMQHPANFRYPQPVRLHPSKPYFVFSPCVLGEFTIAAEDEPMVNRYRYVTFDGEMNSELLDQLWDDFAESSNGAID